MCIPRLDRNWTAGAPKCSWIRQPQCLSAKSEKHQAQRLKGCMQPYPPRPWIIAFAPPFLKKIPVQDCFGLFFLQLASYLFVTFGFGLQLHVRNERGKSASGIIEYSFVDSFLLAQKKFMPRDSGGVKLLPSLAFFLNLLDSWTIPPLGITP